MLGVITCLALFSFTLRYLEPYPLTYPANFGGRFTIPENNPLTKEGVELGRYLFYETKLSKDNSLSCSSCHEQKRAFTDGKPFSEGVDHVMTNRNSMSLANLLWVRNFFWDGRTNSLEEQAVVPLTDPHEMGQTLEESVKKIEQLPIYPRLFEKAYGSKKISPEGITKAIAQFERTLISGNSVYDQYLKGEYKPTPQELRGMNLFLTAPSPDKNIRGANCGHCHGTPKTFIELYHNNGLDAKPRDAGRAGVTGAVGDHGRFRVPTLRNIALTAPYMHDGRFWTLRDVLDHYNDHIQSSATLSSFIEGTSNETGGKSLLLTNSEKADVISFLHLLTDSTFVNDPRFSNPHESLSH